MAAFTFCAVPTGTVLLSYQQGIAVDFLSERSRYIQHIMQIGAAVLVRRGSHGAENDFDFAES